MAVLLTVALVWLGDSQEATGVKKQGARQVHRGITESSGGSRSDAPSEPSGEAALVRAPRGAAAQADRSRHAPSRASAQAAGASGTERAAAPQRSAASRRASAAGARRLAG